MENGLQGVSREAGRAKAQCKAQCSGLGERRRWLGEEVAMAMEGEMGSRVVQRFDELVEGLDTRVLRREPGCP